MKDKQISFNDFTDRCYSAIVENKNIDPEFLRSKYSDEYVSGSKKLFNAIKKEITRKSLWDSGWRLVLVGAIPTIIIMAIYYLMEQYR